MEKALVATVAAAAVTASFPFYLYGAWLILDAEVVTWRLLRHHGTRRPLPDSQQF